MPLYAANGYWNKGIRQNKKLHLFDPFLWHFVRGMACRPSSKNEVIAEACVATHVARFLLEKQGGGGSAILISYWKNGYEIDVVAHTNKGLLGFEIKWSDMRTHLR